MNRIIDVIRIGKTEGETLPQVGTGSPEQKRISGEADTELRDDIHIIRFLPEHDLRETYCGANAFLFCPTTRNSGLPLIESLASGTLVRASDGGALPEILADAAHFVDPNDAADISAGMPRVLGDQ